MAPLHQRVAARETSRDGLAVSWVFLAVAVVLAAFCLLPLMAPAAQAWRTGGTGEMVWQLLRDNPQRLLAGILIGALALNRARVIRAATRQPAVPDGPAEQSSDPADDIDVWRANARAGAADEDRAQARERLRALVAVGGALILVALLVATYVV